MRQPGVEVRPLRQITGSAHFSEVFMTDARAEKADLIGRLGQGWEIAQTTLSYERGGNSLARVTRYTAAFHQLVRAAKTLTRDGRPLLDDPLVRSRIGRIYAELEVQRYAALRVLSALDKGEGPGPASSITKLSYSEFEKRYKPGTWAHAFLWSRAGTIYAGSSEIQKNVIGERVLGLPKDFRKDVARGLAIRCDWGPQYIADAWIQEVKWLGITISPSYVGEPECNGVIERFMRTLKEQCLYLHRFQTLEEARRVIAEFITRYNGEWLIERLGHRTPAEARAAGWRAAA